MEELCPVLVVSSLPPALLPHLVEIIQDSWQRPWQALLSRHSSQTPTQLEEFLRCLSLFYGYTLLPLLFDIKTGVRMAKYPRGHGPLQKWKSPGFPSTHSLHPARACRSHRQSLPWCLTPYWIEVSILLDQCCFPSMLTSLSSQTLQP